MFECVDFTLRYITPVEFQVQVRIEELENSQSESFLTR